MPKKFAFLLKILVFFILKNIFLVVLFKKVCSVKNCNMGGCVELQWVMGISPPLP